MELVSISILTVQGMSENGLKINNMGKVKKPGQIILNMKEIMYLEKKKDMDFLNGLNILILMENLKKITFMEKASINGQMVEFMMEIG